MQAMLQPLDLLVALKFVVWEGRVFSFELLAKEVCISPSSAYRSYERATQAGLMVAERKPKKAALLELILHGVQYVYYVKPGEHTRGMPTAHAAPPLSQLITPSNNAPVWPDPEGRTRGYAVEPLHEAAPKAAKRDSELYELLALVDALRIGRARERKLAGDELARRLRA